MNTDFELFDGKNFSDLCKDIYCNQLDRKQQIESLIKDLWKMNKTANDAMILVPLIKLYMDTGISNDEHLVKLAQICQRLMTAQAQAEANGGSLGLTEDEKKELMSSINEINESDAVIVKTISKSKE